MIGKGELTQQDFVRHTDWDDWEVISKTKLFEHTEKNQPSALTPEAGLPPSPEGFHRVVSEADDQELMREYRENYKLYARRERKLLKEELLRRGLIKKTLGLF